MYVTYSGEAGKRFDRDHWMDIHLPLVREAWRPHGLRSATGLLPSGDPGDLIAICM